MMRQFTITITAVAIILAGCSGRVSRDVPEPLIGVWMTQHAKYADRYFEIDPHSLRLGVGNGSVEDYLLIGFELREEDGKQLHTIHYSGTEGKSEFSFYFDGSIRLVNQPGIVWTREAVERADAQ